MASILIIDDLSFMRGNLVQCMELGAAEVLYKLPKEQELIGAVKRVLGKTGVPQG